MALLCLGLKIPFCHSWVGVLGDGLTLLLAVVHAILAGKWLNEVLEGNVAPDIVAEADAALDLGQGMPYVIC